MPLSPRVLLLFTCACLLGSARGESARAACAAAEPGQQLEPLWEDVEEERRRPKGWTSVASKECRGCLKECLGAKVALAQKASVKYQAPLSLVTWYLFRNRPLRMWPLEEIVGHIFGINPAIYAAAAAASYRSCEQQCDTECPYLGRRGAPTPTMPELARVNAADFSSIQRLLRPQRRRGGGGGLMGEVGRFFAQ